MSQDKREITFAEALSEAVAEEMRRDEKIFVIGEDVAKWGSLFGATKGLLGEFGEERVLDTPISESAITGCGVGAALLGMRPIVEIMYIDFIMLAMDQIVNQAAKMSYISDGKSKVPLVIRTQGGTGRRCGMQHSQSLESFFVHIPGLIVVMPSTPFDAKGLLKSAIREDNPVIFIEHKMLYRTKGFVPEKEYLIPLGKAKIVREGKDITIIVTSWMLDRTLKAVEELEKKGVKAEVIDPRTLSPLDKGTILNSVKKTGKCVIVQEAAKTGGYGAEIECLLMEEGFDYLDAPVKRIAGLDVPIPYGKQSEALVIPQQKQILEEVLALFG